MQLQMRHTSTRFNNGALTIDENIDREIASTSKLEQVSDSQNLR